MNDAPPTDPLSRALGWYRRLQLLYPGVFRARYGEEMRELFCADWMRAGERGGRGRAGLWLRVVLDCGRSLPQEWVAALTPTYRGLVVCGLLSVGAALLGAYLNHELFGVVILGTVFVLTSLAQRTWAFRGQAWATIGAAVLWGPLIYVAVVGAGLQAHAESSFGVAAFWCGLLGIVLSTAGYAWFGFKQPAVGKMMTRSDLRSVVLILGGASMIAGLVEAHADSHALISCCVINNGVFLLGPVIARCWRAPAQG